MEETTGTDTTERILETMAQRQMLYTNGTNEAFGTTNIELVRPRDGAFRPIPITVYDEAVEMDASTTSCNCSDCRVINETPDWYVPEKEIT